MLALAPRQKQVATLIDDESAIWKWRDWQWQVRNAVRNVSTAERLLGIELSANQRKALELTVAKFPLAVTPYYLSLIDPSDLENDPIYMQSFPSKSELRIEECDMQGPLAEDADSPAPCISHRYPDRVLFLINCDRVSVELCRCKLKRQQ